MAAVLQADEAMVVATRMILEPAGLDRAHLEQVLSTMHQHQLDEAELYFQYAREESWSLEDGIVKEGSHSIDKGVGVRAMAGERTGFSYSDDVTLPAIHEAALAARAIARHGGVSQRGIAVPSRADGHRLYLPADPIVTMADQDKVAFLMSLDQSARRLDSRVKQVMASLAAVHEVILVVNSSGVYAADVRPLVRVNISVILESNGRREQGYVGMGGRYALDELVANTAVQDLPRQAIHAASVNLEAIAAPAGTMTVVLASGWPGVMLHEREWQNNRLLQYLNGEV